MLHASTDLIKITLYVYTVCIDAKAIAMFPRHMPFE